MRFFWESEVKPQLFPVKYPKTYYYFAGAYWKKGEIREIHRDVYSMLTIGGKRFLYDGKDVETREKQYSEHKPKRRIFAQIKKKDSVYFLRGKMWQELKQKKKEKPKDIARELWIKGRKLMEENNYTKAIKCFEQAKEGAPSYNPPYYRLGLCYEKIGDKEKALKNYNNYLKLIEGKSRKEKIRNKVQESIDRLKTAEDVSEDLEKSAKEVVEKEKDSGKKE